MAEYKDRRWILTLIGGFLLLVGFAAAFLGPVEIHAFHLFSEGGRHHYAGFRFGSFMFGNIAAQVLIYYLVALVFIPMGYGHLKVRRWVRTLALALFGFWLVVGIPLVVVLFFMLASVKDLPLVVILLVLAFLAASYVVLPWLFIRFYRSRDVRLTFEARDPNTYWTESRTIPVLVLGILFLFYAIVLHIPILFRGIFPVFGVLVLDMNGNLLNSAAIVGLILLAWGILQQRLWAWWASLIFLGLMTTSWIYTLARTSWSDLLTLLEFPPAELEFLAGMPLQGYHLALFVSIPLLVTLGVLLAARRHFGPGARLQEG